MASIGNTYSDGRCSGLWIGDVTHREMDGKVVAGATGVGDKGKGRGGTSRVGR